MSTEKSVLVFGSIGTEVILDIQRYEIVALGEAGQTTWRSRCEFCRTVIFVQSRDGKLPAVRRCQAHRVRERYPAQPVSGIEQAAMAAEAQAKQKMGMAGVRDFLPLPAPSEPAVDNGAIASYGWTLKDEGGIIHTTDGRVIDREPGQATAEAIAEARDFSVASLSAELEGLAPDDPGEDLAPRPTSDAAWQDRLQIYVESRMWLEEWGPRPDQPGCQAPEEVLDRFRR